MSEEAEVAPVEVEAPVEPVEVPVEPQIAAKPEWADARFYNTKTGELNVEDIHKSWSHANDVLNGKKQAPESYELQFNEDVPKEYQEGFDADDDLVKNLLEFSKEKDLSQEGFKELLGLFTGSELEDNRAADAYHEAEMKQLGEHGPRRIKDIELWLDANLDEEGAKALKETLTSAASIEALEKLKYHSRAPQQPNGNDVLPDNHSDHDALRAEYQSKDEFGNRVMQDPKKLADWRNRAAAANFQA
jgi:hypothetical protein